jgi:post-segregation antitoxin (ccd killing protein)
MAVLEASVQLLRNLVRAAREQRWLRENREAVAQYNRRVAEHGLLADDVATEKGLPDDEHTTG